jgi:predicted TIM-barrel fold metal-dependent hydrolase
MQIIGSDLRIDYPVIDADAHVNEPPKLWQERVPARLRERAPRVIKDEQGGDLWIFDQGKANRPIGLVAAAGLSYPQFRVRGATYAGMRAGSYDPAARLEDMDLDGIRAQVLYPSVTVGGAATYSDEPELQNACVRAYNDWLAEFTGHCPDRLLGLGIIPTTSAEAAVEELGYVLRRGHHGLIVSRWPNGSYAYDALDDRFFAAVQEADVPVHIHVASFVQNGSPHGYGSGPYFIGKSALDKSGVAAVPVVQDFLFSGVLDKFPRLKLVLVESNIGWIPSVLEQTDDVFLRYRFWTGASAMKLLPSEYYYRNFWNTFLVDTVGMANRYRCNVDHIMWSTDYPHTASDWPNSRVTLERNFRGLPYGEVRKMTRENAARLYKLDGMLG